MIVGIGIDIVEVARMAAMYDRFGARLERRLLGPQEQALLDTRSDRARFLAGRFAAKEAVTKTLAGFLARRPALSDIQVVPDDHERPTVLVPEHVRSAVADYHWLISISHERNSAVAVALLQRN